MNGVRTCVLSCSKTVQALVKRYGDAFFPAMAVRQLIQAAVDIDKGRALADSGCPMIGQIVGRRNSQDTCFLEEVRMLLRVSMALIQQICTSLPGAHCCRIRDTENQAHGD